MQTLQDKPRQTKILKLVIVGADGRKWEGNQKIRMKEYINRQLKSLLYGKELIIGGIKFKENELWDAKLKRVEFDELIVVSGRCPVGEKRWYCVDCEAFHDDTVAWWSNHNRKLFWKLPDTHKLLKVYDEGGVDTEVEIKAAKLGIKTEIYPAPAKGWEDKKHVILELKTGLTETQLRGMENIAYNPRIRGEIVDAMANLRGYRSRNIQMAEVGNIVIDIEPAGSCKYCKGMGTPNVKGVPMTIPLCRKCEGDGSYSGGTWTLKYARKLGKEVHKVIIE